MPRFALLCLLFLAAATSQGAQGRYDTIGADEVRHVLNRTPDFLEVRVLGAGVDRPDQVLFVAWGGASGEGSPLVPSEPGHEGSPVWLPFAADALLAVRSADGSEKTSLRRWRKTSWGPRDDAAGVEVSSEPAQLSVRIPEKLLGSADRLLVYLKDMAADEGRGRLYGAIDRATSSGTGERTIRHYVAMDGEKGKVTFRARRPHSA